MIAINFQTGLIMCAMLYNVNITVQKMKFSIKDFFSKRNVECTFLHRGKMKQKKRKMFFLPQVEIYM